MTHVTIEPNQDEILSAVLHNVVVTSEPQESLPFLLNAFCSLTHAKSGWYLLFDEPRLLLTHKIEPDALPDDMVIRSLADELQTEMYVGTVSSLGENVCWIGKVNVQHEQVGLICLYFDTIPAFDKAQQRVLHSLIDSLTILTMNIRTLARHEKVSRNQSEFMRVVSHDLRSPLTSMLGFASMLESDSVGELNEQQSYFVGKIIAGIAQLTSLVENIQDAGRFDPETGFYEMERTQCDLAEIVHKIVRNYLVPAEKQELTLQAVIADDVPIILADVNMLERAITNLVDNAIKYTPNGRGVEVGVYRVNSDVIVSVKDDGFGISLENQRMLFERHVRIPRKEHRRVKGSGLGLFIVRSVARQHGGDAWVDSEEGVGSTFSIRIPLVEENLIISQHS